MHLSGKRILYGALNWGLGHASRSVPVIRVLQEHGAEVILAAEGRARKLWELEFKNAVFSDIPEYTIRFPEHAYLSWSLFSQLPQLLRQIQHEQDHVEFAVRQMGIHYVISDNRFGFYSKQVPSVYITHQLQVKSAFGSILPSCWHRAVMNKFDAVWVPDLPGEDNLSGELGHDSRVKNVKYIGPQTRLKQVTANELIDTLTICSGPEPMRSQLEQYVVNELRNCPGKHVMVLGKSELSRERQQVGNIAIYNYAHDQLLSQLISNAKVIISRTGYSTLCDVAQFGKSFIGIPTPGQTEQEYLGRYLKTKGITIMDGSSESLRQAVQFPEKNIPLQLSNDESLLDTALRILPVLLQQKRPT
ncbi:MAG: glycosyltransferase [Bacteroidetes bacterium]|jgi:UDP:flavonoid glycosyltransferase YjiC (YdhE family)|nr:glycosyltransferase [Bacteroidota bacterium]